MSGGHCWEVSPLRVSTMTVLYFLMNLDWIMSNTSDPSPSRSNVKISTFSFFRSLPYVIYFSKYFGYFWMRGKQKFPVCRPQSFFLWFLISSENGNYPRKGKYNSVILTCCQVGGVWCRPVLLQPPVAVLQWPQSQWWPLSVFTVSRESHKQIVRVKVGQLYFKGSLGVSYISIKTQEI